MGRVIAAGGDTVEITEDEEVKINGSKIVENDIFYDKDDETDDVTEDDLADLVVVDDIDESNL